MKLLPLALNVENRKCLVVGGGQVAARKARVLLDCGARVHVVAPNLCDDFHELLSHAQYSPRLFQSDDCNDCTLVFACTDNRETNSQIARAAEQRNLWCNIADDAGASTFHLAAAVRRGEICVGVTTSGASPALSKHLKGAIENCIGDEYAQLLELMSVRREVLKSEIENQSERAGFWREVLNSEVLALLRNGERERAEHLIDELMQRYQPIAGNR